MGVQAYTGHLANAIAFVAFVVTPVAALGGTALSLGGTTGLLKISKVCSDKEHACEQGSMKELALKISKWALTVLAGIVGTLGSLVASGGCFLFGAFFISPILRIPFEHTFPLEAMLFTTGITAGGIAMLILQARVINKVAEHVRFLRNSPTA